MFWIAVVFQITLQTEHGMFPVEALQHLEILVSEIVHRDHIAFALRIYAFHPLEIQNIIIKIPVHGLQKEIKTVIVVMEWSVAIALFRAVDHHAAFLVIIPETQVVMI